MRRRLPSSDQRNHGTHFVSQAEAEIINHGDGDIGTLLAETPCRNSGKFSIKGT
jgi:hypothetical protein